MLNFSMSKGKFLPTPNGMCPFTQQEATSYTAMSALLVGEKGITMRWPLLQRSLLSVVEINSLLSMQMLLPEKEGSMALTFPQSMVLLKSIAHLQRLKAERPGQEIRIDEVFSTSLCDGGTDGTKQLADFNLKRVFASTLLLHDKFESYISGFEVRSNSLENAHVVYKIMTTTTTQGKTGLLGSAVDCEPVVYRSEVTRRYKDFEFLLRILQESANGCIMPPLPSKAFVFNSISDSVAMQRGRELTYFLSKLIEHPVLSQSLAVKVFLEAPAEAFKAYREICLPKPLVQATAQMLSKASAVAETGLKQSVAMFSSFLGMVGKKVLDAADEYRPASSTSSTGSSSNNNSSSSSSSSSSSGGGASSSSSSSSSSSASLSETLANDQRARALSAVPSDARPDLATLLLRLDAVASSADKCMALLDADAAVALEEAQLGSACVALGHAGTEPCIDVQLCLVGETMERIATAHATAVDVQHQVSSTSYSFLGRYSGSAQAAAETYSAAKFAREVAGRALQQKDDSLRRATERYLADSVDVHRATEEHRAAAQKALMGNEEEALALARLQDDIASLAAYRLGMLRMALVSLMEARQEAARDQAEAWEGLRSQLLTGQFKLEDVKSVPLPARQHSGERFDVADGDLQRAIAASLEGGGAGYNTVAANEASVPNVVPISSDSSPAASSPEVQGFDPDNPLGF